MKAFSSVKTGASCVDHITNAVIIIENSVPGVQMRIYCKEEKGILILDCLKNGINANILSAAHCQLSKLPRGYIPSCPPGVFGSGVGDAVDTIGDGVAGIDT